MTTHQPCESCQGTGVVSLADTFADCAACGGTGEARGSAAPYELRAHELADCIASMRQLADRIVVVAGKLERLAAQLGGPSS